MKLIPIIGLEIHTELATKSKMFCSCANETEWAESNTNICPICVGHPGTLPVPNRIAIEYCIKAGLALNCNIHRQSKFDRKNYFYPDLPKGYQISQYDLPFCYEGHINIMGHRIGITRIHLEEDTAKLTHDNSGNTLVDFNRSGVPLMELVTDPHITSAAEAKTFGQELQFIFREIGISFADMEKGQMRCEGNISLQREGTFEIVGAGVVPKQGITLNPKVELKNINSFRFIERALDYEIHRQARAIEQGETLIQETRGWDDQKGITFHQRKKESAHDYRYFPEPDIPPINISNETLREIQLQIPELPQARKKRFEEEYALSPLLARQIAYDKPLASFTEKVFSELQKWITTLGEFEGQSEEEIIENTKKKMARLAGGWLTSELTKLLNESSELISHIKITPENFADFLTLVYASKINSSAAQEVLREMFFSGADPHHIIEEKNLSQLNDEDSLLKIIETVIEENPDQAVQYRAGKETVLMFLVGKVMKKSRGKANPQKIQELLRKKL